MKKSDLFCYYSGKDVFWFRIFRIGLSFSKTMTFSQRVGKSKYLKIGKWVISYLKPYKTKTPNLKLMSKDDIEKNRIKSYTYVTDDINQKKV